jgi:hypothetical protein
MAKLALLLSVLACGLAGYAAFMRGGGDGPAGEAQTITVGGDESVNALARRLQEELAKTLKASEERQTESLEQRERELRKLLAEWTAALPKLQARSEQTASANSGKLEELDAQVTAQSANVEKHSRSVEALAVRLKALESRPPAAATPAPTAATPSAAPKAEEPKAEMPNAPPEDPAVVRQKVEKALADLDSGNPDVIYPAITVVSQYQAAEAVPKLGKLLWPEATQHQDVFTRQAAAAALGRIRSADAVPVLIQAIADRADMVSQQANKSFRIITDHDTELSPKARIQEKRKVVSAALEWWGRHEDEVRAVLKQPKGENPPK